jgi:hypothetical protein
MDGEFGSLVADVQALWASALVQMRGMLLPSRLTQMAILICCLAAAWLIRRWLSARAMTISPTGRRTAITSFLFATTATRWSCMYWKSIPARFIS